MLERLHPEVELTESDDIGGRPERARPRTGSRLPSDPVQAYLDQIGKVPLLSRREEVDLARRLSASFHDLMQKLLESPAAAAEAARLLEIGGRRGRGAGMIPRRPSRTVEAVRALLSEAQSSAGGARIARLRRRWIALLAKEPIYPDRMHAIARKLEEISASLNRDVVPPEVMEDAATVRSRMGEIRRRLAAFERLRGRLAASNLKLVVAVAKRYRSRGLPFSDLIQEGNVGLMRAVDRFDYRRGFRFSTFATCCIKEALQRAVAEQTRTIRLPVHMFGSAIRLHAIGQMLAQQLSREPSFEEIARATALPVESAFRLLRASRPPASLDQPWCDQDAPLTEVLVGDATGGGSAATHQLEAGRVAAQLLDSLPYREREIVRRRFGIGAARTCTLEEVGRLFGITRERARQIEATALRKLRLQALARAADGILESA